MKARGRPIPGKLNKTEAEYAQTLESRKLAGEVLWFAFDCVTLRLADRTHYHPDFLVMLADGSLEVHEVKGFWEDDARVKIKVAASLFPLQFLAVRKKPKKDGGGWEYEHF